jgi:hypothetical protein
MQDVIDEALQRLYWACREGRGFPGVVPDESSGRVSTETILQGLGLSPPAVDTPRPGGLDTPGQLPITRSYHPPDIQPQREKASAVDVEEEDDLADGTVTDDLADGLPVGLADSLPDGLGQQLQDGMDAEIDHSMSKGGLVGYMDTATYPDPGGMHFSGGLPLDTHGRPMSPTSIAQYGLPSLNQQRLESVTQSLGTVERRVWHGQYDQEPSGALPWPGNMTSMARRKGNREDKGGQGDDVGEQS